MHTHIYSLSYVCLYVCVCVCEYICACQGVHIYACMNACMHTNTYIYQCIVFVYMSTVAYTYHCFRLSLGFGQPPRLHRWSEPPVICDTWCLELDFPTRNWSEWVQSYTLSVWWMWSQTLPSRIAHCDNAGGNLAIVPTLALGASTSSNRDDLEPDWIRESWRVVKVLQVSFSWFAYFWREIMRKSMNSVYNLHYLTEY